MEKKSKKKNPKRWIAANRETVRDESHEVKEPAGLTEFEIQAHLWSGLRSLGINARGEVKSRFCGRASVRFDIAVFDGKKLVGIIEVKKSPINHITTWQETRQGHRYSQFGVPVRVVYGMEDAIDLLTQAAKGELWSKVL